MSSAQAISKYVRISPRKARLAADLIRGLPVQSAKQQLAYCNLKAGRLLQKTLDSAIANELRTVIRAAAAPRIGETSNAPYTFEVTRQGHSAIDLRGTSNATLNKAELQVLYGYYTGSTAQEYYLANSLKQTISLFEAE